MQIGWHDDNDDGNDNDEDDEEDYGSHDVEMLLPLRGVQAVVTAKWPTRCCCW